DDAVRVTTLRYDLCLLVVFVLNFSNEFFKNIFQGNDSDGTTIFTDDNGHLHFLLLELAQKMINRFVFSYCVRRMRYLEQGFVCFVDVMLHDILRVDDPLYFMKTFVKQRIAGISLLKHDLNGL